MSPSPTRRLVTAATAGVLTLTGLVAIAAPARAAVSYTIGGAAMPTTITNNFAAAAVTVSGRSATLPGDYVKISRQLPPATPPATTNPGDTASSSRDTGSPPAPATFRGTIDLRGLRPGTYVAVVCNANSGQCDSTGASFTLIAPGSPQVTSTTPARVGAGTTWSTGSGATLEGTFVLNGSNLYPDNTSVTFDDPDHLKWLQRNPTDYTKDQQAFGTRAAIHLVVDPAVTPGVHTATLKNSDGPTTTFSFTVGARPTLTAVTPDHAPRAATTRLHVTGTGFSTPALSSPTQGSGSSAVNDTFAVVAGSVTETGFDVDATIPAGRNVAQTSLTVTNADRATSITPLPFFETGPNPVVTGVSPSELGRGATNTVVTLTGTGFPANDPGSPPVTPPTDCTTPTVTFSSPKIAAGPVICSDSATSLKVPVTVAPDAPEGSYDVTLVNQDHASGTCLSCFAVTSFAVSNFTAGGVSPASIASRQTSAPADTALPVSLTLPSTETGTGYTVALRRSPVIVGQPDVVVAGIGRSGNAVTGTIDATRLAPGAYDAIVTRKADGATGVQRAALQVVPQAEAMPVNAFTPTLAIGADGAQRTITVTGANFTNGSTITIDGLQVGSATVSQDETTLSATVTVPTDESPGPRDLTVTRPAASGGVAKATIAADPFTVQAPPTLAVTAASSLISGAGQPATDNVTITVGNKVAGNGPLPDELMLVDLSGPPSLTAGQVTLRSGSGENVALTPTPGHHLVGVAATGPYDAGTDYTRGLRLSVEGLNTPLQLVTTIGEGHGSTLDVVHRTDTHSIDVGSLSLAYTAPSSLVTGAAPAALGGVEIANPTGTTAGGVRLGVTVSGPSALTASQVHLTCQAADGSGSAVPASLTSTGTGTGTVAGSCGPDLGTDLAPSSIGRPAITLALADGAPVGSYALTLVLQHLDGTGAVVGTYATGTRRTFTAKSVPGKVLDVAASPLDHGLSVSFGPRPAGEGNAGAVSYLVSTSPSAGEPVPADASPVTLTGLTNGTTYAVTVVAVNAVGRSLGSDPVTASPARLPDAPTAVTASPATTAALVRFTAPSSEAGTILDYTVTATPADGPAVTKTGTSSPIRVTGLTNETAYAVTVAARTGAGTGPASSSVSTTPTAKPSAPLLVAGAPAANAIVAAFLPSLANGNLATRYTATATPVGGGTSRSATGTGTPIRIGGLTNSVAYTVKVVAGNAAGDSAASPASAAVTPLARLVTSVGSPAAAASYGATAPITGKVTRAGGAGVSGVTVTVTRTDAGTTTGVPVGTAVSGADGTWTLPTKVVRTATYTATLSSGDADGAYTASSQGTTAVKGLLKVLSVTTKGSRLVVKGAVIPGQKARSQGAWARVSLWQVDGKGRLVKRLTRGSTGPAKSLAGSGEGGSTFTLSRARLKRGTYHLVVLLDSAGQNAPAKGRTFTYRSR